MAMKKRRRIQIFRDDNRTLTLPTTLGSVTFVRLVVNIARRFPYPLLPIMATLLGVPLTAMQGAIAWQSAVGIGSPVFGPASDRLGRRIMMLGALGLLGAASVLAAVFPSSGPVFAALVLVGVAKAIYDPAMQAYLASRIPYERRAFAIGVTELSWAGGLLIGAPAAGYLLEQAGLAPVFWALAAASALGFFVILLLIGPDIVSVKLHVGDVAKDIGGAWWRVLWRVLKSPSAVGALTCMACLTAGNESLLVTYGAWMQASFSSQLAILGLATAALAVAELLGDVFVIGLADRLGKGRVLGASLGLSSMGYVILPHLASNLPAALTGLFLTSIFVETAYVVALSVFTELTPSARATLMSGTSAADKFGRVVGAYSGGYLYSLGGFTLNGWLGGGLSLLAFLAILTLIPNGDSTSRRLA